MKFLVVSKGKHRSTLLPLPTIIPLTWVGGTYTFTDSCAYELADGDQDDWNKLVGATIGLIHPHTWSARVAWRYKDTHIELTPYLYKNGKRVIYDNPVKVDLNVPILVRLEFFDNKVFIRIGEKTYLIAMKYDALFGIKLNLYFGGNKQAPHKIIIIKDL